MTQKKRQKRPLYPYIPVKTRDGFTREDTVGPKLVPPWHDQIKIPCPCGVSFSPEWGQPTLNELHPFVVQDDETATVYRPPAVGVICKECGRLNDITIKPTLGEAVTLYGDESYSPFLDSFIYIYCFVALSETARRSMTEAMENFKRSVLKSGECPKEWKFHTHELREGDRSERIRMDQEMATLARRLRMAGSGAVVSLFILPGPKYPEYRGIDNPDQSARNHAVTAAIFSTTEYLTEAGFTPSFVLEATKPIDRKKRLSETYMDDDIEAIGRSLNFSLGYYYVCRGHQPRLPYTVAKGTSLELDLADLIAYWVRRDLLAISNGKQAEIKHNRFGRALWGVMTPEGLRSKTGRRFPFPYSVLGIDSPS